MSLRELRDRDCFRFSSTWLAPAPIPPCCPFLFLQWSCAEEPPGSTPASQLRRSNFLCLQSPARTTKCCSSWLGSLGTSSLPVAEQHTIVYAALTEPQTVQVPMRSPERFDITAELCSFPEVYKQTQILAKPSLVFSSRTFLKWILFVALIAV